MTCIVGIVEKNKIYMGGDSAGVDGLNIVIRKDPKVFRVGEFVIGCTTSFRMVQLIRFSFKPPKKRRNEDTFKYMCTKFVDSLRKCFKKGGFLELNNSVESGGCFLVGYNGRLFSIHGDFQVGESNDGFDSVGCGNSFALGALSAMNKSIPAKDRIIRALEIASHHSGGVRPPFIIEEK